MDDIEFGKHVDLIMSMSLDFKMGGIDRGTYESNLRTIVKQMAPLMCTCANCTGVDLEACYRTDNEDG